MGIFAKISPMIPIMFDKVIMTIFGGRPSPRRREKLKEQILAARRQGEQPESARIIGARGSRNREFDRWPGQRRRHRNERHCCERTRDAGRGSCRPRHSVCQREPP